MTREERNDLIKRMAALRKKRELQQEMENDRVEFFGRRDDGRGTWSDFEKESAFAVAELRKTHGVHLSKTIIADDRSRADKTPHQILQESESIEERRARELQEKKAENLRRYLATAEGKRLYGEDKPTREARLKDGIDEAKGKEDLAVDHFHRVVLNSDDKEVEFDWAWRHRQGKSLSQAARDFEKRFAKWRDEQIEKGIRNGYLARDEKGEVVKVHKDKDRPGERMITGRARGVEGPGD